MKPTEKPHLLVGALSHPGEEREHNEDRYSVTAYRLERSGVPSLLAIVADGIGGHQAGEVAAEITVEAITDRVGRSSGRDPLPTLRAAVTDAARAVIDAAGKDSAREGMGSTVAIVWILGDRLYLTYVGDSRIYLQREDRILQLSNDHTWVQEALDHEIISPQEAEDHPHAHVLRRHIGGDKPPEPDLRVRLSGSPEDSGSTSHQGLALRAHDHILLCSDGLTDLVHADELAAALSSAPPAQAAQELVDLARSRGGHDNITVIALEVPPQAVRRRSRRWLGWGVAGVLAGSLLIVAAALALTWRFNSWPWRPLGLGFQTPAPAATPVTTQVPAVQEAEEVAPAVPPTASPTPGPTSTAIPLATAPSSEQ